MRRPSSPHSSSHSSPAARSPSRSKRAPASPDDAVPGALSPALFARAEAVLGELLRFSSAADVVLSAYFRRNPELGRADRAFVAELAYTVLRRRRSLAERCAGDVTSRRLLLAALACEQGLNRRQMDTLLRDPEGKWLSEAKALVRASLPPAVRCDLPDWLHALLVAQYGEEATEALAEASNRQAPLDLRVNVQKATREAVIERLVADGIAASATPLSPIGVRLNGKPSLAKYPLFLDGSIEVQDEGSQLLGFLLQPRRGEMVADFCAGAGGKTLLLGALMRSQGRLYAFDVSARRLAALKPRLARSGLSNVHPVCIDSERDARVRRLAGKLDRVLVDAPCSGLGTLRRNPDLKWRQTPQAIAELGVKQASILAAAATLVKPGGRLVYATCSPLAAENDAIVDAFIAAHPEFTPLSAGDILREQGIAITAGDRLRLSVLEHGVDGFFAAVFQRQ
ncbi:RsmB/NOP family class I SAM-dependent RNA methyltransferase [Rhodocyclus tenuis]|uniref:RsmB/NOP family class I SAM-dependent RNA methyltransferase n=1 Tax=Rhodocyclus gracilis TaxID=2929842 RepID=A0ABX0WI48_9RHOO|nr:RsmB/NOP family class I SAM-dependent RNA methyltransferase [Rhodocyclus gracilis]NJA89015.1 RsmB/NOP family class I SAM-dependent RNA methyltransferase [Rhodocyclus gracilis]